jgi:nitrite reductase/ring-hydroxylating ferredoxin subunit
MQKQHGSNSQTPEPHWKSDFSVDWEETSYITRREFSRFLALGSAVMALGNVAMATFDLPNPSAGPRLALGALSELELGGFKSFEYPQPGHYAILLRQQDGAVVAFSQRCPHLGCSVHYSQASGQLECPCHEGFFDARTGAVLAGPPQRGLVAIELAIENDQVFAVGGGEG